jgi:hypothetical protein
MPAHAEWPLYVPALQTHYNFTLIVQVNVSNKQSVHIINLSLSQKGMLQPSLAFKLALLTLSSPSQSL